jgi:hypothetical protein
MSAPFVPIDLARVADVLDGLGLEIESLGGQLCADPAFVAGHVAELQAIDRIAQYQHALARVLRAECIASAIELIGIEELAARLRPASERG